MTLCCVSEVWNWHSTVKGSMKVPCEPKNELPYMTRNPATERRPRNEMKEYMYTDVNEIYYNNQV